jgi:hypothetical protein
MVGHVTSSQEALRTLFFELHSNHRSRSIHASIDLLCFAQLYGTPICQNISLPVSLPTLEHQKRLEKLLSERSKIIYTIIYFKWNSFTLHDCIKQKPGISYRLIDSALDLEQVCSDLRPKISLHLNNEWKMLGILLISHMSSCDICLKWKTS